MASPNSRRKPRPNGNPPRQPLKVAPQNALRAVVVAGEAAVAVVFVRSLVLPLAHRRLPPILPRPNQWSPPPPEKLLQHPLNPAGG